MPLDTLETLDTLGSLATDLRHALDPVAFARDRFGFEPDDWQAEALRSPSKRMLLNCSRQSGKSTTTAIIALHTAYYQPGSLVLLLSPSLRQSRELFAKVSNFQKRIKPRPVLEEDNRLSFQIDNGSRVVSLPGTGETVRGFSKPALIIEDEAAFCGDDLYIALRPMLAVSGGRLILMSTPNGRRGHFFEAWESGGDRWQRFEVPATQCPRITPEFLATERADLGDLWYRQEYECLFMETADQVFGYNTVANAFTDDVKPLFGTA